jgi:hypothetical protein
MSLNGEYQPSQNDRTREQVELYEATNGVEGGTLNGKPVIVLTYKGAKSGKIRKTPLMRIEHNGTYAVVASYAGTLPTPSGTATSSPIRSSSCRMARSSKRCGPAKSSAKKRTNGGSARTPPILKSPNTEPVRAVKFRCSS